VRNNNDIIGAKNILLNISFGEEDVTMDEIFEITHFVQDAAGNNADLIWGYNQEISLGKKINVTIIATGFETDVIPELYVVKKDGVNVPKVEILKKTEKTLSEEVGFEVAYAGDDIKLEKSKQETFNVNESILNEGFEVEKQDDEIIVHEQSKESENTDDEDERVRKALEHLAQVEKMKKQMEQKNQIKERNAKTIDELENIPAYKRRNLDLKQENFLEESKVSRYVLKDDDDQLSENSFLHDNVD